MFPKAKAYNTFVPTKARVMNDLLLDNNGDLKIENGDFVIGDATLQNQNAILQSQKGEFKEHPEVGVGLDNGILDENPREIISEIRKQFIHDGLEIKTFDILENGDLIIDANYK